MIEISRRASNRFLEAAKVIPPLIALSCLGVFGTTMLMQGLDESAKSQQEVRQTATRSYRQCKAKSSDQDVASYPREIVRQISAGCQMDAQIRFGVRVAGP